MSPIKHCQNLFLSLTYLHLKSLLIFLLFNKSYFQEKVVVSAFESVIALGEEQNHDQTLGIYFVLKCILNFFLKSKVTFVFYPKNQGKTFKI